MGDDSTTPFPAGNPRFRSTRWSVVLAAQATPGPDADRALATLCETYWYPLYAFARRRGQDAEAAQDLTQEFFARLLDKRDFGAANPARGKFRSFLLGAFVHHMSNERERAAAWKRGGRATVLPLDLTAGEERYCREPADNRTPEKLYERRWALTLLETVLQQLRREHESAGRDRAFEVLSGPALTTAAGEVPYRTLAAQLGMTETAVKVAVHRLRHRYRELIRETVAQTLTDPRDVEDEIRFLFAALGG
jgi:RNA polymerase sigma-70 factor (ECF subfamily)